MTKAIINTYTAVHEYSARIVMAALVGSVIAALFYAVNLYTVISHTVAIGEIERETSLVIGARNDLDAQYLDLGSAATPDTLAKYGLTAGKISAFISRTSPTASAPTGVVATRGI